MKKLILLTVCLISLKMFGQKEDKSSYQSLVNRSLIEQLKFELKSSDYLERNVSLVYRPLQEPSDTKEEVSFLPDVNGVNIKYLSNKEIKAHSRKGINYLKIYPIILENDNTLSILVEMINLKRKTQILIGSSTYYFKINCEQKEVLLYNKSQNIF